jgi:prepilin-type N-terminal cleavage/methylation domain-containing protein
MHKKRAFTLIELLVVIAIIALLMSILMPALAKVRKQAMSIVCRSRMKQWGTVFSQYTSENDGYFHSREVGTTFGYSRMWPYVYKPMYNDPKMRFCPTAENPRIDKGPFGTWNYGVGSYYPLPDLPMRTAGNKGEIAENEFELRTGKISKGFFTGSFGMNRYVENMKGGTMGDDPAFFRRADVKGGDKVPVLLDCQYNYYWSSNSADPPGYNGDFTAPEMHWACIDRHMGYNNVVFLDSSARKVGLKELWTLKQSTTEVTCGQWTICGLKGDKVKCKAAWDAEAPWMSKMPEY